MKSKVFAAIVFTLLGVTWAIISPIGSAPDDDYHLASIWCVDDAAKNCSRSNIEGAVLAPRILVSWPPCYVKWPESKSSAKCIDEMELPNQLIATFRHNGVGTYPELFYKTMNIFAGDNIYNSIISMRIFNLLLATTIFFLALISVTNNLVRVVLGAWGLVLVPQGIFLVASTNPSSWAITSVSFFWIFCQTLYDEWKEKRRTNILPLIGAFVCLLMAIGSRKDTIFYIIVSIILIFILNLKFHYFYKQSIVNRFFIFIITTLGVFSLLIIGSFMTEPKLNLKFPKNSIENNTPNSFLDLILSIPAGILSLFGGQEPKLDQFRGDLESVFTYGLSWQDFGLPSFSSIILFTVFIIFIFLNKAYKDINKNLSLLFIFGIYISVIVWTKGSYGENIEEFNPIQFQPRYFIPLLVIFTGVALYNRTKIVQKLNPFTLHTITLLLSIAISVAWLAVFSRYTNGVLVPFSNLRTTPEWWPQIYFLNKSQFFLMNFIFSYLWIFSTITYPNLKMTSVVK
jgi:Predicted membrane protein (DUF2142)